MMGDVSARAVERPECIIALSWLASGSAVPGGLFDEGSFVRRNWESRFGSWGCEWGD